MTPLPTHALDTVYTLVASAHPSPGDHRIVFSARSSGLYRSGDRDSWQSVLDAMTTPEPLAVTAVALSPDLGSGTTDHVFAGVQGGILRSLDGGETWQSTAFTAPAPLVSALLVSPDYAVDSLVLAGTLEDGIFRSEDQGQSWHPWNFGLFDRRVLCLAISPNFGADQTVFAGTETGLYRSSNGGRAWREVGFPHDRAPVLSVALSPAFADDGILLAGTEAHGLYGSLDDGKTWNAVSENALNGSINQIIWPGGKSSEDVLALCDGTVFRSHDRGHTWNPLNLPDQPDSAVTAILAPDEWSAQAPIWLGFEDGRVARVTGR